ncbi:hypothetical protein ACTND8_10750 [Atopobiaceae bacterium HCP3S3_F7]
MFFKKLKCDGIALNDIVKISKVIVQPVADIENQSDDNAVSGRTFLHQHRGSKIIQVEAVIPENVFATIDRLNRIFTDKELVLELEEQPVRVYRARFSKMSTPTSFVRNADITFEFEIFDGISNAKHGRIFNFAKNAQGIMEATIVNDGSKAVHVNYEVELAKESGFLGIVTEYGASQFGKVEEVDGVIAEKSVQLASNKAGNFANWTNGTVFYENQTKKSVTTMTADTQFGGRLGILPGSFTNSANGRQFGAIKELALSESAQNWYLWAKAWFETGQVDQTGAWCLAVVDSNNNFIAGMAIEKTNTTQNQATVHFLLGDGAGGSRSVHYINFTPSKYIPPNPYGEDSKNENRNMFDIRKEEDKVTFFWYGKYFVFYESKIRSVNANRIQFFVGQYIGRSTAGQLVTRMYLNDFSFTKIKVPYWKDIPNRYKTGSILQVFGEEGRLYVDNQVALSDEILGTRYIKVPPGETKIQLLVSSFSEIKRATAEIKEAFS